MSKISVIVPIYNVEEYLAEAIDSLINQTIFSELNVILVNDGSTDNSGEIAMDYASRYSNINYYNKENGGLSSARNYGLKFVESPYTMFLDSDDKYTETACENLYEYAIKNDLEIVVGDLETFPVATPKYTWKKYYGNGNLIIDITKSGEDLLRNPSACNKIFKTSILKNKKELFPVGKHFEDAFAIIPLMISAKKIGVLDDLIYLYRQRKDGSSIMNSLYQNKKNYYDYIDLIRLLHEKFVVNQTNYHIEFAVNKFIYITFHGFINNIFLNHNIHFDDNEKSAIFDQIHFIYKNINFDELKKLNKHRLIIAVYYALSNNLKELFLRPEFHCDKILIRDGILYDSKLYRYYDIGSVHLYASIESLKFVDNNLIFIGEIISNNAIIDINLSNDFKLRLIDSDKKKIELPIEKFSKEDSPFINDNKKNALGIKIIIPKSIIERLNNSNILHVCIIDPESYERKVLGTNAHYLLQRFKGEIDRGVYLDVLNNNSISIKKNYRFRDKLNNNRKKIIHKNKLKVGGKLRLLHHVTNWYLKKKKIVLIAERPDTFQDNSAAFFKYVNGVANKKKNYYYLIDKKASKKDEVGQFGKVIYKDSIKHLLYLLSADTLVNSYDPDSYMGPSAYSKPIYFKIFGDLINYNRVFLQHGVTYNNVAQAISNYRIGFDGIVITNKFEKEMMKNKAYYTENQLIESGFPRYTKLKNYIEDNSGKKLSINKKRIILLMPTWRKDLAPLSYVKKNKDYKLDPSKFLSSEYFHFYNQLLNNKELNQKLKENNILLKFFPHYEMRDFLKYFELEEDNNNVEIVAKEENVQDLLIECDLLITDYSSVFFDVLYMKKPVIFTQFDLEEFYSKHYKKGYLDFKKNELGPSVSSIDETVTQINQVINNNFIVPENILENISIYLEYANKENNNKIILDFIENL